MSSADSEEDTLNHAERAAQLLALDEDSAIATMIAELHPVAFIEILNALPEDTRDDLLRRVSGLDQISNLVAYSEGKLREDILAQLDDSRIGAVVRRLPTDDAADVVGSLPRRRQVSVLRRLSTQRAREILSLVAYDKETAGGLMTTHFLSFPATLPADEALARIRERLAAGELDGDTDIHGIYLVDDEDHLLGVCTLRRVLAATTNAPLSELAIDHAVSVSPDDNQERVIQLTKDYDLYAIPVVAPENEKLLGIITVDDVLDVMEDEYTKDILRLAGTEDDDSVSAPVTTALRGRLPWLLASWMGGILGAMLLGSFSSILEKYVALAFFMPVVFGMGGNVGSQSSTITVRGLALGEFGETRLVRRIQKEALVGMTLGALFAVLLGCAALVLFRDQHLSEVVALSIFVTMTCSATMGSIIPVAFKRLGYDPAVSSGPLVTTLTDILSILIYFSVSSFLLA